MKTYAIKYSDNERATIKLIEAESILHAIGVLYRDYGHREIKEIVTK